MSAPEITRPPQGTIGETATRPAPPPRRVDSAARALVTDVARHHADELLRHATRAAGCADDAHDAYQRTLELMLEHAHEIDRRKALSWAHTVIAREARRLARQRATTRSFDEELDSYDYADRDSHASDPVADVERIDATRRAQEILATLPEHQAQAVCLRAQGLSYDEIGAALGWSDRKVKRAVREGNRAFEHRYRALAAGLICAATRDNIRDYVAGNLSMRGRTQLRAHLTGCPGCRATMHAHRGDTALLALLPPALTAMASEAGQRRGWVSEHLLTPLDQLLHRSSGAIEQLGTAKLGAVALSGAAVAGTGVATHELRDPQPVARVPIAVAVPASTAQQPATGSTSARVTDAVTAAIRRERAHNRQAAAAANRRAAARRKAVRARRQQLAASREFTPAASEFTNSGRTTSSTSATQGAPGTRSSDSAARTPATAQAPQEVSAGGDDGGSVDVVTEGSP